MIRLTRSVSVSSFDVEATVALGRERPEFLAVARLAADLGRPIGARDVLRELLGPRPEVLGRRVIERCVALGLLDAVGNTDVASLSDAGRLALAHGEVLVPEEGIWRFLFVQDPLVPTALIDVQHVQTEPVRKERAAAKAAQSKGQRLELPSNAPDVVKRSCDGSPRTSARNGHLFQLLRLSDKGSSGPAGDLRLTLTWEGEPSLRLSGRLPSQGDEEENTPIDAVMDLPDVVRRWSEDVLWKALVAQATRISREHLDLWQNAAQKPVVPLPFPSLPEAARRSFRHDLEVPAPDLPGLGRFDRTALKNVDVVPASPTDAQAWLSWLQWEAINDYVVPAQLERAGAEQRARFPLHQPRVMSAQELLHKAYAERGERSWFLLAPYDLGLWSQS